MGRFLTPDPSGLYYADPNNPQSLDLYAYVANNPLTFIDPSGLALQLDCFTTPDSYYWAPDPGDDDASVTVTAGAQYCTAFDDGQGETNDLISPTISPTHQALPLPRISATGSGNSARPTPSYCAGIVLKKDGVALSLDAAGDAAAFIPGGGFAVAGVQMGVAVASTVNSASHRDVQGSLAGIVGFQLAPLGSAAKYAAKGAGEAGLTSFSEAIPFAGGVVSAYSTIHDVVVAYADYQSCMAGH